MFDKPCFLFAAVLVAATACGSTSGTPHGVSAAPGASQRSEPLPKGYASTRDPKGAIAGALQKAKADNRPVLLDFGADWCVECVILGRLFRTDAVREALNAFHLVAVDVGKFDRNLDLVKKYGLDLHTSGIPALVVLSPNGKVRATTNDGSFERSSSMSPEEFAAYLGHFR